MSELYDIQDDKTAAFGQASPTRGQSTAEDANIILELGAVSHHYDGVAALDDVSISAKEGEFLTLLGPSGSGKTTLLKIIAGLERPSTIDALSIAGQDVCNIPAHHRNVVTVFQHYALFPHMTVGENVEYGLRLRRVAPAERNRRALEALELVRLPDKYPRRIHQLSGGERQRVALARALVVHPALLLLDEPLGALDEKLRVEMQVELLELQRSLGTTFIYVTHSQEEALTMSDRIVLMNHGRIEQEGVPHTIYERPVSRFVADFMGVENVFEGEIVAHEGDITTIRIGDTVLQGTWTGTGKATLGTSAFIAARAQLVQLTADDQKIPDACNRVACRTSSALYKGKYLDLVLDSPIGHITARTLGSYDAAASLRYAWWGAADCVVAPVT